MIEVQCATAVDLEQLAGLFAGASKIGLKLYLQGELGAGKTTFVRGFLRGLDYTGPVKSPTYTLVEPYQLHDAQIYHFDFYRIAVAEELESFGVRDYFAASTICLVEWPERAAARIPEADILVSIKIVESGRELSLDARTALGEAILSAVSAQRD